MGDTLSRSGLYGVLRDDLLAFVDGQGRSLAGLACEVYCGGAPSQVNWSAPYAVCRLVNGSTSGETHGQRETVSLELMVFGRPRGTMAQAVELAGDVIDRWLLQYRSAVAGLVFSKSRTRDTLPAFLDPADREVYQIRIVAALVVWPQYLTQ